MKARLSDQLIKNLETPARVYEICDTELNGFRLVVRPSGNHSFVLRYRNAQGRRQAYTLGQHGKKITTAVAREAAKQHLSRVGLAVDIQAEKKQEREKGQRLQVTTLGHFMEACWLPWGQTHLKSWQGTLDTLNKDFKHLQGRPMADISRWDIQRWQAAQLKRGLKATTVNRRISSLKGVLSKALEWGILETHPLHGLKKVKEDRQGRVRYLSQAEEERFRQAMVQRQERQRQERLRYIDWCRARHREPPPLLTEPYTDYLMPMCLLAMNTGMRRGELFSLEWTDLNFHTRQVRVRGDNAKSSQTRFIPLNDESLSVLQTWERQSRTHQLVFPSPVTGAPLDNINSAWKNLVKLAGLSDFRFHDLRHHFASWLVMQGVNLYSVKNLLGHASIETTQRYAHLADDHMAEAVNLLVQRQPSSPSSPALYLVPNPDETPLNPPGGH